MAEWSRKKVDSSNINNNKEYSKVDRVPIEQLNAMVNAGLYAQDFAEKLASSVDNSEINNVGTPTVSFEPHPDSTTEKPYMRFKFSNLKGEKGDKGEQGIQGEAGTSALPLGMILPCSVVTNDARFHLLDGSSVLQSGIYEQFSIWLKERIAENSSNVPTCTIEEYASEMTTYGQCGKFVINDTDTDQSSNGYTVYANSIKLPTITEFIASSNGGDAIGLAELDMFKSHSHIVPQTSTDGIPDDGGVWDKGTGNQSDQYNAPSGATGGEETRPKNIRYPYYIVVATAVKTDVEVDIDNVASDINAINGILTKTEQVETIYDMNDSAYDWGKTGGLVADIRATLYPFDINKYKKLIVYARLDGCYGSTEIELDKVRLSSNGDIDGGIVTSNVASSDKSISSMSFRIYSDGNFATLYAMRLYHDEVVGCNENSDYIITRIEGVY